MIRSLDGAADVSREPRIVVMVFFAVCVLASRFSLLKFVGERFIGGAQHDAGLYVWLVEQNGLHFDRLLNCLPSACAATRLADQWMNSFAFYPYGETLAWSDNFLFPSLIVWVLSKIGFSFALAYNLLFLSAQWLNGYCVYILARQLSARRLGAAFAGAAFLLSAAMGSQLGHPQLQFAFFLPLSMYLTLRLLRSPSLVSGVWLGLTVSSTFLTTVYYALFAVVLCGLTVLSMVLMRREVSIRSLLSAFVGGLIGFSPVMLCLPSYFRVRDTFGSRNLYESYYFSADLLSYLSAGPLNLLYGFSSKWSHSEAQLFGGLVLLFLCALALRLLSLNRAFWISAGLALFSAVLSLCVTSHRGLHFSQVHWLLPVSMLACIGAVLWYLVRVGQEVTAPRDAPAREAVCLLCFGALVFFFLSFGPTGNPEKGQAAWGLFRLFYEVVPGFNSLRAIGRAGIVVVVLLCCLSAFGVDQLVRNHRRFLFITLLASFGLENFIHAIPVESRASMPKAMQSLSEQSSSGNAAIVLPFSGSLQRDGRIQSWTEFSKLNTNAMQWALQVDMPVVNGYSGQITKIMRDFPRKLESFPDASDRRWETALSTFVGLRHIVFVSGATSSRFDRNWFLEQVREVESLTIVNEDNSQNFLLSFDPIVTVSEGFYVQFPASRRSSQRLELQVRMLARQSGEQPHYLCLRGLDGDQIVARQNVQANGDWHELAFDLPPADNIVRPQRYSFELQDGNREQLPFVDQVLIRDLRHRW